jgi:hypothetical protein
MKEPICELAREQVIQNEEWRHHASGCPDCRELLVVTEWMTTFAGSTAVTRELPTAGYLFFKARLQEKLSAADRAALPLLTMIVAAGILLAATIIALLLGGETRVGSIMIDAFSLLSSHAGLIVIGAVIVAAVCVVAGYLGNLTDPSDRRSRNN